MRIICSLTLVFLVSISLWACDEPIDEVAPIGTHMETDAFIQNQKFQRSINLGNILEAPTEGAWGLVLEEAYFSLIAEAGFTGIRLPVRWSAHADTSAPFGIDPVFLSRVDWAIDQAFDNDLAIVVNVHHYVEMMEAPPAHLPRLLAIWHQLASHLSHRSDDLILELFNEPNDAFTSELWNAYFPQIIDTIRAVDPHRTLMVGTAPWGGIGGLDNLVLPEVSNLIVTVHYYSPFQFTHQGAEWSEGADAWLGTTWGYVESDFLNLQQDLQRVKSWSTQRNRPINVGEFGAYDKAEMASRILWTRSVSRMSEDLGFSWSYWEFASGFGAYDLQAEEWNDLLYALIPN